jgi:putative ABC transport system permease protein
MFKNYLKIAARNLRKHKLYSFINISGLALGIAGSSLMLLFILDELSYERHHEKAERIYAVFNAWNFGNYEATGGTIAPAMAPALKEEYPEIAATVRSWTWSRPLIIYKEKRFYEERFVFADPSASPLMPRNAAPKKSVFAKCSAPRSPISWRCSRKNLSNSFSSPT